MAEMLEADATARRAQAYAIDPTLNPGHKAKAKSSSWLEDIGPVAKKAAPKATAKKPAAKRTAAKK
jgi:hypothetical protein